ncbi:MAG: DUF2909 domain-containing protein [Pseudomonadota bacterium]
MTAKIVIAVVFLAILVALGIAFKNLMFGDRKDDTSTVRALTYRVGLSVALLIVIVVMASLGLIEPNQ